MYLLYTDLDTDRKKKKQNKIETKIESESKSKSNIEYGKSKLKCIYKTGIYIYRIYIRIY